MPPISHLFNPGFLKLQVFVVLQLLQLCCVDAKAAERALREMYTELINHIQIEPLIPQFIAYSIITPEDEEIFRTQQLLPRDKTGYILDKKIIQSLSDDVKKPFEDFLLVIENSEDTANKSLASKLKLKCDVSSPPAQQTTTQPVTILLGMFYY